VNVLSSTIRNTAAAHLGGRISRFRSSGSTHRRIWKGLGLLLAFIWSAMSSGVTGTGVWAWRYHNEVTKRTGSWSMTKQRRTIQSNEFHTIH
jgi:hypothetical protein